VIRASRPRGYKRARTTDQGTRRSDDDTSEFLETMKEYASIDVDLIQITPRAEDSDSWVTNFESQVVPSMGFGRQPLWPLRGVRASWCGWRVGEAAKPTTTLNGDGPLREVPAQRNYSRSLGRRCPAENAEGTSQIREDATGQRSPQIAVELPVEDGGGDAQ
jgi:hypothetical protein